MIPFTSEYHILFITTFVFLRRIHMVIAFITIIKHKCIKYYVIGSKCMIITIYRCNFYMHWCPSSFKFIMDLNKDQLRSSDKNKIMAIILDYSIQDEFLSTLGYMEEVSFRYKSTIANYFHYKPLFRYFIY